MNRTVHTDVCMQRTFMFTETFPTMYHRICRGEVFYMTKGEVFWNNVKMIKEQRGLKGWADIAQECGCSLSRLETMMYRKSLPRLDLALAISKTLCVDVDLLLSEYKVFPYLTRRDLSEPEVELIKLVRVGNSVDQQYKRKMLVTLMNTYNEKLIKNRMLTPMEISNRQING